jgi:transitional endoplasmic reticulum ATPase
MILKANSSIGVYNVQSFIKEGQFNESYIVKDSEEIPYFLKIYDPKRIPSEVLSSDSIITEIDYCEKMKHPNVISFVEKGVFSNDRNNYPFLITNYIHGNLVADPLTKGRIFILEMTLEIAKYTLKGLSHIHSLGLLHNDITPRNIIYTPKDLSKTTLIDLGHVSEPCNGHISFETDDLTPFFRAPETYDLNFDIRSDIYSVAAVMYAMLYGKAPWSTDLSNGPIQNSKEMENLMSERLSFSGGMDKCPNWLQSVLKACLSVNPDYRIQTAEDLLDALENEHCPQIENAHVRTEHASVEAKTKNSSYGICKKEGNGFADVAGMDDIKAMLQQRVLFLLKNPDKAKKYKLTPPNGMLLYGPPGCGKTFFAEKFAEEASLNFIFIKASDVGSTYIHGSQGKIAQLFSEAETKAPSVICFDEFDAMVPKRSSSEASSLMNPEVNEFLSQMNNCSQRGIFVIGTTNQKELIDPAVLRTGRMDLHVEICPPDKITRKKMFDLYLKDRPCVGVDTDILADKTDNYSSSDIAFIVNDAALVAAFKDSPIDQAMLEESIDKKPSSLGKKEERRKIGF